ncbi:MAG: 6-phosphogluconate dehydrogenase [Bacteroidetes bacterium]|nr:6-phosphogluconate dehydrogenase [Bacteroidota bacterium]
MRKLILYFVAALVFFSIGYFAFASFTYSQGSRTGLLMKFSDKGYIFKTWEGELNLGGVTQEGGSLLNNIWQFSVLDNEQETIDALNKYEGKRIRLSYKEKMRHFPWQGETNYFVYKAEAVE